MYSPQIYFLPLSLQALYAFANWTLVTQFLTFSKEHWLGVQGGQSARVWLLESSVVFCVQNVLPFSLCGQKMRSAPWLASTRPPDRVSLTPVDLWRVSTIRWDPRTEVMKIIWRIMIKKWEKSYYLMIMTVIMIPSLSLLSLTPVEDSLVILTPPMSICQYFAKNDALQQKQCIATFCGKSLQISYPMIIWTTNYIFCLCWKIRPYASVQVLVIRGILRPPLTPPTIFKLSTEKVFRGFIWNNLSSHLIAKRFKSWSQT